jgi:hypothetical protein
VRSLGVGIMNLTGFLLSSNNNSKIDGKRIIFRAVDFRPHPPTLAPVFIILDREMDLMIGSLNFRVRSLGSTRLSDPINSGPLVGKTASAARSESSIGSSSEVNSPVNFKPMENIEGIVEELDEIMENLDLGESSGYSDKGSNESFDNHPVKDLATRSGGVSDSNEDTWRLEGKRTNNIHQMCIIIREAAEDDDGGNNPVINSQGDNQGNNHRKEREKVYVSTGEWRMIKSAVNRGMTIPADSRREVLMGYQYAMHQHKKQLLQEKSELRRSHESNSAAKRTQWEEHSDTSRSSEERYHEPKHNRRRAEWPRKEICTQNLNSSFIIVDET